MYTNQTLPNDEAFKTFFQLPEPTQTLTFDWLGADWYEFDETAKKRDLRPYYDSFYGERSAFLEYYNNWLTKYTKLYEYWVERNKLEVMLPEYEIRLIKPLGSYAVKDRWAKTPEYSNPKAQLVNMTQRRIEYLTQKIDQTLAIADAPPQVPNSLLKSWSNLLYMVNQQAEFEQIKNFFVGVRRQNKVNLGKTVNRKGVLVDSPRYAPEPPQWDAK